MFILVSINKFKRSRLTFDFSAKVAHIGSPINIFKHSFLRNHLANWNQISYNNSLWLVAKIYTNCYGHLTKMATTPIYGKLFKKSSSLEPKGHFLWDLVCSIGDVGPSMFAQMMNLGWPWPTLWQGQYWFLMHLYGENLKMFILAEIIILVRNVKPNESLVLYEVPNVKLTCDLLSKATDLDRHTPI